MVFPLSFFCAQQYINGKYQVRVKVRVKTNFKIPFKVNFKNFTPLHPLAYVLIHMATMSVSPPPYWGLTIWSRSSLTVQSFIGAVQCCGTGMYNTRPWLVGSAAATHSSPKTQPASLPPSPSPCSWLCFSRSVHCLLLNTYIKRSERCTRCLSGPHVLIIPKHKHFKCTQR